MGNGNGGAINPHGSGITVGAACGPRNMEKASIPYNGEDRHSCGVWKWGRGEQRGQNEQKGLWLSVAENSCRPEGISDTFGLE